MTDQKPNCSTCQWWQVHHIYECDISGRLSPAMIELIKKVGCLSHPGARAWLMRDVIEGLQRRGNLGKNKMMRVDTAIALIKNGVESK